jgi:hypothetical protein
VRSQFGRPLLAVVLDLALVRIAIENCGAALAAFRSRVPSSSGQGDGCGFRRLRCSCAFKLLLFPLDENGRDARNVRCSQRKSQAMILYGSSMSPYVRKVLAFAGEKEIELDVRPIGIGSEDPEFRKASPFGKMPALVDGDFGLADSSAIIHYLEAGIPIPH